MPKNTVGERKFWRLNIRCFARVSVSCVPWGRFDWALARASFAPEFSHAFFLRWILEREEEEIDTEEGKFRWVLVFDWGATKRCNAQRYR